MNEKLQEFVDSRGVQMRVERQRGVIRGVKILGLASRNGRTYLPEALGGAVALYEDAKVNVNHPKGSPLGPRDYQDRIGVIRNVVARPSEGLFADFHFNPKHSLAEQLIWDAEHAPENVGFSHNVQARTSRRGDRVVVEAITKVQSVDLVADPATTRGLFESASQPTPAASTGSAAKSEPAELAGLTVEDLRRRRPDLVETLLQEQTARRAKLEAEIDRLQTAEALRERRLTARRLLSKFGLPDPDTATDGARSIVSDLFVESLLAAPGEEAMREMVEDRARLVRDAGRGGSPASGRDGRPVSRDQHQVDGTGRPDAKAFVETIT